MSYTRINPKQGRVFDYTVDGEWTAGGTKNLGPSESWAFYCIAPQGGLTGMFGCAIPAAAGGWVIRAVGMYFTGGTSQTINGSMFTISEAGVWTYNGGGRISHNGGSNHTSSTAENVGYIRRLF